MGKHFLKKSPAGEALNDWLQELPGFFTFFKKIEVVFMEHVLPNDSNSSQQWALRETLDQTPSTFFCTKNIKELFPKIKFAYIWRTH